MFQLLSLFLKRLVMATITATAVVLVSFRWQADPARPGRPSAHGVRNVWDHNIPLDTWESLYLPYNRSFAFDFFR